MSAQRRTTVPEKAPVPAAPTAPAKKAAEKLASGSERRPRDRSTAERGRPTTEGRQSVLAARTQSVQRLFRDSMSEIRKVNWPDQETARNLTFLVVGISVVLGLALGGIDFVLQKVFEAMT
jgi:preprotein translocase SecE subunit